MRLIINMPNAEMAEVLEIFELLEDYSEDNYVPLSFHTEYADDASGTESGTTTGTKDNSSSVQRTPERPKCKNPPVQPSGNPLLHLS